MPVRIRLARNGRTRNESISIELLKDLSAAKERDRQQIPGHGSVVSFFIFIPIPSIRVHSRPVFALLCAFKSLLQHGDIVIEQLEIIGNFRLAADRGRRLYYLSAG